MCKPGCMSPSVIVDRYNIIVQYLHCYPPWSSKQCICGERLSESLFGKTGPHCCEVWVFLVFRSLQDLLLLSFSLGCIQHLVPSTWGWSGWNLGPQTRRAVCWSCVAVVGMKGLGHQTGKPGSPSWLDSEGASVTGWPECETPVWCFTQYPLRERQWPFIRWLIRNSSPTHTNSSYNSISERQTTQLKNGQ